MRIIDNGKTYVISDGIDTPGGGAMEINAEVGVKVRNTFEFELENTVTGEVKH